jgi:competence protein ComEA
MLDPDRRHLVAYIAAAAVLVVLAVRLIGHAGAAPTPSVATVASAPAPLGPRAERPPAPDRAPVWVDVAGAVRRPGLYSLPAGARVAAALERAGGPLRRAEVTGVNLAAKLADGQQVVVPERGHGAAAIGAATATPGASAAGGSTGGAPAGGAKISLSTATQEQLESLDGIGPALATRIIQYRDAHGGFRSIDQLQDVSGIGDKRFQALRGSVQP